MQVDWQELIHAEIDIDGLPLAALFYDAQRGNPNSIELIDYYFCRRSALGHAVPMSIQRFIATRIEDGRSREDESRRELALISVYCQSRG